MIPSVGLAYHIKDAFFLMLDPADCYRLMSNRENGRQRPHLCISSHLNQPDMFWMVPLTTKVEKFKTIRNKKISQLGFCNTIEIGSYDGIDAAFLIQNMTLIHERFIDHEHLNSGVSVRLHQTTLSTLSRNAQTHISLIAAGNCKIFTPVESITQQQSRFLQTVVGRII